MQDMLQNKTQVETVNFRLYFKVIGMLGRWTVVDFMTVFFLGVCFLLYFFKLLAGHDF